MCAGAQQAPAITSQWSENCRACGPGERHKMMLRMMPCKGDWILTDLC